MSRSICATYAAWCTTEVIIYSHFAKEVKLLAHRTGELSLESYAKGQVSHCFMKAVVSRELKTKTGVSVIGSSTTTFRLFTI
jgi:hypothetical protein